MFETFKRLFQQNKYCPFCGSELIHWAENAVDHGRYIERAWTGCPKYVEARAVHDYKEQANHVAYWEAKKPRSNFDPKTGKPI